MSDTLNNSIVRLELGAGARKMPGWISLDVSPAAMIKCDLEKEALPFGDNSVDEIYHTLYRIYGGNA